MLGSIESLIEDTDFFTAVSGSGVADFYFFGAVAGHAILDRGLEQIRPQESYGYRKTKTGPRFLNTLIADHRDEILLLKPPTLKGNVVHHAAPHVPGLGGAPARRPQSQTGDANRDTRARATAAPLTEPHSAQTSGVSRGRVALHLSSPAPASAVLRLRLGPDRLSPDPFLCRGAP